ncbi:MAG: citrulline utilization hydrolase CtlX [Saprospiraceae bacterium]
MKSRQITDHVLMVRPANFGFNSETAESNAFQTVNKVISDSEVSLRAIKEFDVFVSLLRSKGIQVTVIEDTSDPIKPDAVFPNNWFSTHRNGYIITYPVQAELRRLERQEHIVDKLAETCDVQAVFPLENYEDYDQFLEGTGSMILDRDNRIVYACLSPRTNEVVLDKFCKLANFEKLVFNAIDGNNQDIYHTNVMMALGEDFVVICLETIKDPNQRKAIKEAFAKTGKTIIRISLDQMMAFAGNMLQLRNRRGERFLVMSSQAHDSLYPEQIQFIEQHTKILHSPIKVIETIGGGSVRCMMAEVFLKEKTEITGG